MASFILTLCSVVLTLLLLAIIQNRHKIMQYFRIYKALKKFPSPPCHWLYGHLLQLSKIDEECVEMIEKRAILYDKCYVNWYSIFPGLVCTNAEAIKAIIQASTPKGDWFYSLTKPWLGHGLLAETGQRWARNRRLLTSAFHYDILKTYTQIYNDCVDTTIEKWNNYAEQGKTFDIYEDLKLLTFDTIMQTAFSLKINCQTTGKNHPYVLASRELTRLLFQRVHNTLHHSDWIYRLSSNGRQFFKLCDYVNQFSEHIINERKKILKENQQDQEYQNNNMKGKLDFVDILLHTRDENGQELSAQEIRDEVNNVMFAGHDTTSSACVWTLYCLAKYPQHQEKVREEVERVLSDKQMIDHSDLANLNYTHMCIKEAMRLYPTVPVIERKLNQDLIIHDKLVPKGTTTFLELHALCIRPEVWSNPKHYDPLRFTAENVQIRDPFLYIPFSAGQRNCIGKSFATNELKIIVAKLVSKFEFQIDPDYPIKRYFAMVNQPDKGLWLKIKKRN